MAETATRKKKSQSNNLGHAFIRLINLTQITISFLVRIQRTSARPHRGFQDKTFESRSPLKTVNLFAPL